MSHQPKPRYFPVTGDPLTMRPGLFRLGTDFGNGEADRAVFVAGPEAVAEKARVLTQHPERLARLDGRTEGEAHARVLSWMQRTSGHEPEGTPVALAAAYRELSVRVAEDFVLTTPDAGGRPRVSLVSVCFPSGWAPERILGLDFQQVHAPVPEFERVAAHAEPLTEAMWARGPYVRFVWTLTPDERLDHHPSAPRVAWNATGPGYLRVERQVTVPFPGLGSSLFLIRTFLTPFEALSNVERERLTATLSSTSETILAYKGLLTPRETILGLLRALPAMPS